MRKSRNLPGKLENIVNNEIYAAKEQKSLGRTLYFKRYIERIKKGELKLNILVKTTYLDEINNEKKYYCANYYYDPNYEWRPKKDGKIWEQVHIEEKIAIIEKDVKKLWNIEYRPENEL